MKKVPQKLNCTYDMMNYPSRYQVNLLLLYMAIKDYCPTIHKTYTQHTHIHAHDRQTTTCEPFGEKEEARCTVSVCVCVFLTSSIQFAPFSMTVPPKLKSSN